MEEFHYEDEGFRDSLTTVSSDGKRKWVFAKKPFGWFTNARDVVNVICLAIMFGLPFIKIDGHPFFLFNILDRRFILFGVPFFPQDFFIFLLATLCFFVFIILFTAIYGRVWCGWTCPQTVFMEGVFRKIEYLIEGDYKQQITLSKQEWNTEKIRKRGLKYFVYLAISFLIANTVMAYLIGIDQVKELILESPAKNSGAFIGILIFTAVFMFVFSYLREQVCTIICPYGRLQGVLLNKSSIVVAYDFVRGEPRGKIKKGVNTEGLGDCIDCKLCVHVCPTSIDIRNGTQLECINCTACIDACDDVMTKVNRPTGLIRYDSQAGITEQKKFKFDIRIIAYSSLLVILIGILCSLLLLRTEVDVTVLRVPGQLYQENKDGTVSNLYNVLLVNKTFEDREISIQLEIPNARTRFAGEQRLVIPAENKLEAIFFIDIPKEQIKESRFKVKVKIMSGAKEIKEVKTSFIAPAY